MNLKNLASRISVFAVFTLALTISLTAQTVSVDTSSALPATFKAKLSGDIVYKAQFTDKLDKHLLVCLRSKSADEEGNEKIVLDARQYFWAGAQWRPEWRVKDSVECQGLDMAGDFIPAQIVFTDIDKNNIVETTVSYNTICTGGVAPKTVVTSVCQGNDRYAVCGESLVKVDDIHTAGGTFTVDKPLAIKPEFKKRLVKVWKMAAGVR
jgi:hypothetical protein